MDGQDAPKAQDIVVPRAPHDQFARADSMAKADPSEPIAGAVAQMRTEALWLIDEQNVFYKGLGKSYEAGLQTQRDTIAAYMQAASRTDSAHPNGWNPTHETAQWHAQMTMAFGLAAGGSGADAMTRGAPIAAEARRALLDSVLIPYDARFGQYKDPNQISGFGSRGRLAFAAWLSVSNVTPAERERMLAVWDGIIGILEQCRRQLHARNDADSRLNWMPMQLALEAKDHDTQEKVDNLIERWWTGPSCEGNAAVFMLGMQFQLELANQIASARSYHVLWIHDYRGIINGDQPDSIGAFQTLQLPARADQGGGAVRFAGHHAGVLHLQRPALLHRRASRRSGSTSCRTRLPPASTCPRATTACRRGWPACRTASGRR